MTGIVVVWKGIHSGSVTNRTGAEVWDTLLDRGLRFVQRRRTRNSVMSMTSDDERDRHDCGLAHTSSIIVRLWKKLFSLVESTA